MSDAAGPSRRELSPAAKAWLVAGAAACFVVFLATLAFKPELSAGSSGGAHALSRSPSGFAGLVRLLRADGAAVRMNSRRDPGASVRSDALLVITPVAATSADEIRRLAHGRRVLLIAAKWTTSEAPDRPGLVIADGRLSTAAVSPQVAAVLAPDAPGSVDVAEPPGVASAAPYPPASDPVTVRAPADDADPRWRPRSVPGVRALRTIGGAGAQPVFVDERERILVAMAPKGVSFATAEPDLFDNHALADPVSARTAVGMVEEMAAGGPVVFDLTLSGVAGDRNALRLAFSAPFLPATAAALLLAALLGLMAPDRFGVLRRGGRAYAFGKRALVDTTASLIEVVAREPRLAGRYADLARTRAAQAAGAAPGIEPAEADALLDRIGRERGVGAWTPLAAEAKTVATRAALTDFARRVHHWRMEMTLGRG